MAAVTSLSPAGASSSAGIDISKDKTFAYARQWCLLLSEKGEIVPEGAIKPAYSDPQEAIKDLAKIKAVRINGAELKELPRGIHLLSQLNTLDLINNQLSALPDEDFKIIKALKRLYLDGNQFTSLPAFIADNAECGLESVTLNNNPLTALPYARKDIIHDAPAGIMFT